jgi:tetratricopeptide (TPR) repeat protein
MQINLNRRNKMQYFVMQQKAITTAAPDSVSLSMIARPIIVIFGLLLALAAPLPAHAQRSRANTKAVQEDTALHPVAKSEQERTDFNASYAVIGALALEKAANQFAEQYPDSDLRQYLYSKTMRAYELENNPAGVLAMAQKLLAIRPDHALALVLKATVLADQLESTDADRAAKADEIRKTVNLAIESVGKGFVPPPAASMEEAAVYRTTLQSMAYSAVGIMELKVGEDAKAEKDLNTAAVLTKITPDAYIWYHLALAQDHRKKYAAALNSVQQALQLASSNPELQRLAEIEFDRLSGLAGRGPRGADQQQ